MKNISLIYEKIKIFFRYLSKILPLFIGIAALYIAIESLDNANRQFQINSKSADSLFNIQLKNSKELNDSLINQISILQDITNKQLQITDKQLKISTELFQDQLYSGRPKIVVLSNEITDTIKTLDYTFSLRMEIIYENIGNRMANELTIRTFTLVNNFSTIQANRMIKESYFVEPNGIRRLISKLTMHTKYKDNFYYCYDIIYYDEILKQEFIQSYYYQYHKHADIYSFYHCNIEDEEKIRESLNNWLRVKNERLFDQ